MKYFSVEEFRIPFELVEIKHGTYMNWLKVKSVYIPYDIEIIRERAFEGCICIEEINASDSFGLRLIEANAFKDCRKLTKISFNSSLKDIKIHPTIFDGCESLKVIECSEVISEK